MRNSFVTVERGAYGGNLPNFLLCDRLIIDRSSGVPSSFLSTRLSDGYYDQAGKGCVVEVLIQGK